MQRFSGVFITLLAVLIMGLTGCDLLIPAITQPDDNDWVGTWNLQTIDGESLEQLIQETEINGSVDKNEWTFNSDGTWGAEILFRIQVEEGGVSLTVDGSWILVGTYSLSGSNYTLELKESVGFFDSDDPDTGTWVRENDTLTLHSDDGSIIIFKKKQ